jgi:7-cyano-7-deazaguanine synthase in queuosine biosynthesis
MILLMSGGIDSIIAHRMRWHPAVYFKLGTKSEAMELRALDWVDRQDWAGEIHYSRALQYLGEHELDNGYVPYRNGLLVTWAAMRDPNVVVAQVAEWAPDKNLRYWRRLERTLTQAGSTQKWKRQVTIITPYARYTKGELLKAYMRRFGPGETAELLLHTWSCYEDGTFHCGLCAGCQQRKVAELVAKMPTTIYEHIGLRLPETKAMAVDGLRWVRDNRDIRGPIRRAREVHRYRNYG